MRTLAITQNISLDGSIEFLDDWFDPADQGGPGQDDLLSASNRMDDACDAIVLGRRTFEDFRGYWPHRRDDTTGITAYLDGVQKYVVSSTLDDPGWQNSHVLRGDPVEAARELKERRGLDIVVTGSITLTHALIAGGLVDEYRLFTYPVVQGRGRRLFPEGFELARLRMLSSEAFRSGVVLTTYASH